VTELDKVAPQLDIHEIVRADSVKQRQVWKYTVLSSLRTTTSHHHSSAL